MAVEVKAGAGFEAGVPALLFETWITGILAHYDVSRDGRRFVMAAPEPGAAASPAVVILNWQAALKK
jgi:hypothetical protein